MLSLGRAPRIRRGLVVVSVACAATFGLLPSVALADTDIGETGLVGAHALIDNSDKPGATCTYKDKDTPLVPYVLAAVKARPPQVFARNVTSIEDQQKVGWRFIVEKQSSRSLDPPTVVFKSSIQKLTASESTPAAFVALKGRVPIPTEAAHYTVKVKMFWYRNGSVEGTSVHLVDFYKLISPQGTQVFEPPDSFCIDGIGN